MNQDMKKWENIKGKRFLEKIGLKKGQKVLDFGCKKGHYTIPAAKIVGKKGIIYAIDKRKWALKEIEEKAEKQKLKNIKTINTKGKLKFNLKKELIDFILAYDVLHYFSKPRRRKLYKKLYKILKPKAILSIYPKHNLNDHPLKWLKKISIYTLKKEIEESGFAFTKKYCCQISHDDNLNRSCVFNFIKI